MYLAAAAVIKRGRRVCGRIFDHFYRILDSISSILNYDFETGTLGMDIGFRILPIQMLI